MAAKHPRFQAWEEGTFDRRSYLLLSALIATALGASLWMSHAPLPPLGIVAVAGIGLLIVSLLSPTVTRRVSATKKRLVPTAYFVLLLVLAATVVAILSVHRALGLSWLLLMPIVAVAVLVLSWPRALVVAGAATLIFITPIFRVGGWREVPESLIGFSAALVFVMLFSRANVNESRARAESERLAVELSDANRKLSDYALRAEDWATARERNRVAREIHDGLGHVLTTINVQLEAALVMADRERDSALDAVRKAKQLSQQGLFEVRRSVSVLRGSPLEGRTLAEAIREMAGETEESGITTEVRFEGEMTGLRPEVELTLFRVTQEALTNVRRHSHAKTVRVGIDGSDVAIRLLVEDDGLGTDSLQEGFGLLGSRERVGLLGGSLDIVSGPERGFRLTAVVPR